MDSNPKQLLTKVVKLLDRLGIAYVLTGGLAVTIWGVPRYTQDADLIIQLQQEDLPKLKNALEGLSDFGYVDEAMMIDAFQRNSEFNYIDSESGFKVDLWMPKSSPFVRSCFDRRVSVDMDGQWDRLDWNYIESWTQKLGLGAELTIAKSFVDRSPL